MRGRLSKKSLSEEKCCHKHNLHAIFYKKRKMKKHPSLKNYSLQKVVYQYYKKLNT